jgi:hypothetical protein
MSKARGPDSRIVFALMLAAAIATPLAGEERVFVEPSHGDFRVDACESWGQGCGQQAADAFCQLQQFERASEFRIDPRIGAATPTRTLKDQRVCDQPHCDGFKTITCVRPDSPPPSSVDPPVVPPGRRLPPRPGRAPSTPPPAQPLPPPPSAPQPPWTPKEVMDARIDVQAQYALFRMLKGSPAQKIDASHLLSATKEGALSGIYQEDQQVPAMRAQELGKWWGQILPKGTDATCLTQPPSKPPIVVMRRGAPSDKQHYDDALSSAWAQCLVPAPWPVRPYDASAPGDPPSTGAPQQCHGAAQMANALKVCEDYKNARMAHCETVRDLVAAGEPIQTANGPFVMAACLTEVSTLHDTCQQLAYAACR